MNRTLSFLFAAALGATLGALISLEFAPLLGLSGGLAATLGVIVGGLTGYIAVDFRQFCLGVLEAGRVAYTLPAGYVRDHWNSSRNFKLIWMYTSLFVAIVFFDAVLLVVTFAGILTADITALAPGALFVPLPAAAVGFLLGLLVSHSYIWRDEQRGMCDEQHVAEAKNSFVTILPHKVIWFILTTFVPWLVRQTGVFGKTIFIAVHSERRMLCCFDATLGTLVGYYAGSWPAGTVAGLAFALVSYELVSKRLLKLQTA
jgi:hypothetical protein